ncbi:hypothetical protein LguiB_008563 [Lonicera macranthoides]
MKFSYNRDSPEFSSSSPPSTIHDCALLAHLRLQNPPNIVNKSKTFVSFNLLHTFLDLLWQSSKDRERGTARVRVRDRERNGDVWESSMQSRWVYGISWRKLYQRVYHLDSVSCRTLSDPTPPLVIDQFQHPRPRASHSLNFLSGCLLLFGGGSDGGRHLDDTWIAYIGNDFRRISEWQMVTSGIPSGRFGHSCVVIGDSLVLFGGINDHGIRQNDTWIGQVALKETTGISLSWRLLEVGPIAPPPRGAHAGCSTDNQRMLIHGGIGLSGVRLGDTWVLDLSENLCTGTWREIVTQPSPAARSGHTLTHVGGTQTVLFGGRGLRYEVLHDVWLFDTSEGHLRWVQLLFELCNIPGGLSLPRVGHSATLILGGQLLIHGGEDTYRRRKNDFWVLDIGTRASVRMQPCTIEQRGLSGSMWRRLKSEGYKPKCRSFHRACTDRSGRYLYVFGGMVDGLLQPAEGTGLRFDGELFLVELVL